MSNGTGCGWVKVANLPSEAVPDVGNVVADPTTPPSAGQLAQWTDPTTIGGLTLPTSPAGLLSIDGAGGLHSGLNYGFGYVSNALTINSPTQAVGQWRLALGGAAVTPRTSGIFFVMFMGTCSHTTAMGGIAIAIGHGPMPYPQTGAVLPISGWNVTGIWDPVSCTTAGASYQYSNMILIGNLTVGEQHGFAPVMYNGSNGTATMSIAAILCFEL